MKFRYIGSYASDDQKMETQGYVFSPGIEVEVSEPAVIAKLMGNRFFEFDAPANEVSGTASVSPKRRGRPVVANKVSDHDDQD